MLFEFQQGFDGGYVFPGQLTIELAHDRPHAHIKGSLDIGLVIVPDHNALCGYCLCLLQCVLKYSGIGFLYSHIL